MRSMYEFGRIKCLTSRMSLSQEAYPRELRADPLGYEMSLSPTPRSFEHEQYLRFGRVSAVRRRYAWNCLSGCATYGGRAEYVRPSSPDCPSSHSTPLWERAHHRSSHKTSRGHTDCSPEPQGPVVGASPAPRQVGGEGQAIFWRFSMDLVDKRRLNIAVVN
jgi:hypothetical protein